MQSSAHCLVFYCMAWSSDDRQQMARKCDLYLTLNLQSKRQISDLFQGLKNKLIGLVVLLEAFSWPRKYYRFYLLGLYLRWTTALLKSVIPKRLFSFTKNATQTSCSVSSQCGNFHLTGFVFHLWIPCHFDVMVWLSVMTCHIMTS